MKLTPKQELFCQEYLIDLNATQAAIRAGYSKRTSNEQGCQNLAKLSVAERIAELKEQRNQRVEIKADAVIRELAKIAFASAADLHVDWDKLKDWDDLTLEQKSVIAEVKVIRTGSGGVIKQVKMYDKLRALESLARHTGCFEQDNAQQQVPVIIYQHVPSNPGRKDDELKTKNIEL